MKAKYPKKIAFYNVPYLAIEALEVMMLPHLAVVRLHCMRMRHSDTDVAWSVSVLDTLVSSAVSAEQIKMPFRLWTRRSPRNHVLDRGLGPLRGRALLRGHT